MVMIEKMMANNRAHKNDNNAEYKAEENDDNDDNNDDNNDEYNDKNGRKTKGCCLAVTVKMRIMKGSYLESMENE